MHILIIEDEQLAYEKLQDYVNTSLQNSKIHWLRSVKEVKSYLEDNLPDLIFSDIKLLDGNVFEAFDEISMNCPIIFTTAFNKYLKEAFDTNGIAYLLKPFTKDEFLKTLSKYESLFSQKEIMTNVNLSRFIKNHLEQNLYKSTFPIKKRDGVFILNVNDIVYFQAQGDFVLAIDNSGHRHIINKTLKAIDLILNPNEFFRINRSEVINFNYIKKYRLYIKNRLEIELTDKSNKLFTSNSRSLDFKNWVDR